MSPLSRSIAWGVPLALVAVHQVVAPRGAEVRAGLPLELWVRLAWIAVAWVYLVWFARTVWTGESDGAEAAE